jgi:hypothetical protein
LDFAPLLAGPVPEHPPDLVVHHAQVGGLGLDTSSYSIPYITSWSQNEDSLQIIETCAHLIDRLAKRIEDAIGDPPADPARAAA